MLTEFITESSTSGRCCRCRSRSATACLWWSRRSGRQGTSRSSGCTASRLSEPATAARPCRCTASTARSCPPWCLRRLTSMQPPRTWMVPFAAIVQSGRRCRCSRRSGRGCRWWCCCWLSSTHRAESTPDTIGPVGAVVPPEPPKPMLKTCSPPCWRHSAASRSRPSCPAARATGVGGEQVRLHAVGRVPPGWLR